MQGDCGAAHGKGGWIWGASSATGWGGCGQRGSGMQTSAKSVTLLGKPGRGESLRSKPHLSFTVPSTAAGCRCLCPSVSSGQCHG